ncbi:MAG: PEP-CTERM sorting domain-containing protein, partial [Tepidisphaeraceae bacterium]
VVGNRSRGARVIALLAISALLLTSFQAPAAPLPVNTTIVAVSELDPVGATSVAPVLNSPFAVPGFFNGVLTSSVYNNDPSNPFGPAALTFTYQLTNVGGVGFPNSLGRVTINDYAGFLTDASYQTASGFPTPSFIDRDVLGDIIGFSYFRPPIGSGAIAPGDISAIMVVQTDATLYKTTLASVIDGNVTTAMTYAPAVPEPSTLVLSFLVGAATLVRRRDRSSGLVKS